MNEFPEKRPSDFTKGILVGALTVSFILLLTLVILNKTGVIRIFSGEMKLPDDETVSKLNAVSDLIDSEYYGEAPKEYYSDGIMAGLVNTLDDKYADYFSAEEYERQLANVTKQYYGIGATLMQDPETGRVTVVYVYDDTPAQKGGLAEGDEILSVNGVVARKVDLDALVEEIQGDEGTEVELIVSKGGTGEPVSMKLVRAVINVPTVGYEMLENKIGYIQISRFANNTPNEFNEALEDLKKQGMKGLILDVRYNAGGIFSSCVEIVDEILPKGTIVYVEDKYGKREYEFSDEEHKLDMPLVVLINESSASASEILAGAIRDHEYGTLIGTKTYGKGIVQKTFGLKDGSAVKFTVEKYFTPNGENIQDVGIEPDIELEFDFLGTEDQEYAYDLDNQIQKGIEVLTKELL